jgi:hypothetical protein
MKRISDEVLQRWEREAKDELYTSHATDENGRVLTLIWEFREVREQLRQEQELNRPVLKSNAIRNYLRATEERLKSAEDALHPFSSYEEGKISTFLSSYTEKARAHFDKYSELDKLKAQHDFENDISAAESAKGI